MSGPLDCVVANRDMALMSIGFTARGQSNRQLKKSFLEGYAPAFEGKKESRGLPFVQAYGIRAHYRKEI